MASAGRPNVGNAAEITTSEARGTPAIPFEVTKSRSSISIC